MHVRATLVTPTLPMGTDSRTNRTTSTQGQEMSPVPRPHPHVGVLEAAAGSWFWPKHSPGHCSHLGLTEDLSHSFKYINFKKKIFFLKILQFFLCLIFNIPIKVSYLHTAMYLISIPIPKTDTIFEKANNLKWSPLSSVTAECSIFELIFTVLTLSITDIQNVIFCTYWDRLQRYYMLRNSTWVGFSSWLPVWFLASVRMRLHGSTARYRGRGESRDTQARQQFVIPADGLALA